MKQTGLFSLIKQTDLEERKKLHTILSTHYLPIDNHSFDCIYIILKTISEDHLEDPLGETWVDSFRFF